MYPRANDAVCSQLYIILGKSTKYSLAKIIVKSRSNDHVITSEGSDLGQANLQQKL